MARRLPPFATSAFTFAALALLSAGCGGGGSKPATGRSNPPTGGQNQLVAYSHCMRAHGVADFPDPTPSEGIPKDKVPVSSPQFSAASNDCEHLMPASGLGPQGTPLQQRTRLADLLSFARCMRGRNVGRFPDPTEQGSLTLAMVQAQGVDVHSPAFLRAVQACLPASHGALKVANVREALAEATGQG